ncbi:hypothetical protein CR513_54702, partial [Mucuna pruriens]
MGSLRLEDKVWKHMICTHSVLSCTVDKKMQLAPMEVWQMLPLVQCARAQGSHQAERLFSGYEPITSRSQGSSNLIIPSRLTLSKIKRLNTVLRAPNDIGPQMQHDLMKNQKIGNLTTVLFYNNPLDELWLIQEQRDSSSIRTPLLKRLPEITQSKTEKELVSKIGCYCYCYRYSQKHQLCSSKLNPRFQARHSWLSERVCVDSGSSSPSPECKTDPHRERLQTAVQSPAFSAQLSSPPFGSRENGGKYRMRKFVIAEDQLKRGKKEYESESGIDDEEKKEDERKG